MQQAVGSSCRPPPYGALIPKDLVIHILIYIIIAGDVEPAIYPKLQIIIRHTVQ